jgi:hypothetical protein
MTRTLRVQFICTPNTRQRGQLSEDVRNDTTSLSNRLSRRQKHFHPRARAPRENLWPLSSCTAESKDRRRIDALLDWTGRTGMRQIVQFNLLLSIRFYIYSLRSEITVGDIIQILY